MKKTSIFILLLIIVSFIIGGCSNEASTIEESSVQQEQLECPKGLEHEPSPGSCPLYRDENKDGFCDFG